MVYPCDKPLRENSSVVGLWGNLAEEGSISKINIDTLNLYYNKNKIEIVNLESLKICLIVKSINLCSPKNIFYILDTPDLGI